MNPFPPAGNNAGPMGPPGLARYGSAPGSLLAGIAESVINSGARGGGGFSAVGSEGKMGRFFPGESSGLTSSESSCRTSASVELEPDRGRSVVQGPYGLGGVHMAPDLSGVQKSGSSGVQLVRHSSSPAGLLSHLLVDPQGISGAKAIGNYSHTGTETINLLSANSRLRPQWSFSRQDSLSQISEISIPDIGESVNVNNNTSLNETGSMFTTPLSKRARDESDEFLASFSNMDEMSNMEEYLQMNQDVATCKLRAKRGYATHPRSIAERERRTRISKRLRNLQDLVPNMDKQTSTSDMLDLAVQYIKDLQSQVQKLKEDQEVCTCSSKLS